MPTRLRLPLLVAALVGAALLLTQTLRGRLGDESVKLRGSVFRIRNYAQAPDFANPWKYTPGVSSFGTGFYIGDGRILTNAHVISGARFLTVQRTDGRVVPAKVAAVAHDADMAILKVGKASFLDGLVPLAFGELPQLRSPVYTIGYPLGGEKVSITEGVVSRIDYRVYAHTGFHRHLLIQVDSAINPGNSGGPVVQDGKVVGIAFQVNRSAQGTGYLIPTPLIQRFLTAVAAGRDGSHPDDGLYVQENALANPATAEFYGLVGKQAGVLVTNVAPGSPFAGRLKRGDVLTAIDGHAIGADGRVLFRGERVDFKVYYDLRQIGEMVAFTVQRDARETAVTVKAQAAGDRYTPGRIFPDRPDYLVYGGLVFETLSRNYLETWGDDWYERAPAELRFLHAFWDFAPTAPGAAAPVVLAARLPHEVNAYVDVPVGSVVTRVDGHDVTSLTHMRSLLAHASDDLVVIDFAGSATEAVLSRREVLAATDAIAETYRVEQATWLTDAQPEGAE